MRYNLNKILIASGFIGPAVFFFTIYFLFAFLYPGYNIHRDYISELGAVDSPIRLAANVLGFSLFGVFIILFSYGVLRIKGLGTLAKLGAFFIFITGVLMYLVGIFPCDAECVNYSIRGDIHTRASDYQFPVLGLAYVLLALAFLEIRRLSWLVLPIILFGAGGFLMHYLIPFSLTQQFPGIIQRASIGLPYLAMAIIAATLYSFSFEKGKV
ncbi:DUF998 domain-containing protein [Candidatus Pacearchaeota archaeon]|nr:DUF998 domain-containing protein [Candidatus Pacearchaeota archaeon]